MFKKATAFLITLVFVLCIPTACKKPTATPTAEYSFERSCYGVLSAGSTALTLETLPEDAKISYESGDTQVASVDENGNVTGVSKGETTVTARVTSSQGNGVATAKVFVDFGGTYQTLNGEEPFVKWAGRVFSSPDGFVNCFNVASGFEVEFYGTTLSVVAKGAGYATPQMTVLIDGETDPTARVFSLPQYTEKELVLAENLDEGVHHVRVYSIIEPQHANLAFGKITTDGYFTARPKDRAFKIEAYGDSITAGFKNMRETQAEPESIDKTQNGCMTYAWLFAERMNADIHIFARSGIGLYNSLGSATFCLKNDYDSLVAFENTFLSRTVPEWDFKKFIPDLVVINIGTNDANSLWNEGTYANSLLQLVEELCEKYGNPKFPLCYNAMTGKNETATKGIAKTLREQGKNALAFKLKRAAFGHPTYAEHADMAIRMELALEEFLAS